MSDPIPIVFLYVVDRNNIDYSSLLEYLNSSLEVQENGNANISN